MAEVSQGAVVLENDVDRNWNMRFHAMAMSQELLERCATQLHPDRKFEFHKDALRMWHIEKSWPVNDIIEVQFQVNTSELVCWPIVAWNYADGKQRISEAIVDAGVKFVLATGLEPMFAFIRQIPKQVEEFVEVKGIALIQADWVPTGCLAVGRGGMIVRRKG